ncbi:IG [Nesidiocoris tenuis]|uniref:IG n=1 Tax=Nesidiocoris tenuis TaxID=355587 RepID=A0ABN7AYG2_9HEMI|nr:IG [Nesidiocoris tenuis]
MERTRMESSEGQNGRYECLKDVVLIAPSAVKAGTTLHIACHYDLEGDALYSLKFYQGDQEFYRFVPKESPPTRVFPIPDIQVDIYSSNNSVVTLNNVQRELSGVYKCEVSADAPSFHTIIQESQVTVVVEPLDLPTISIEKLKYTYGEKIKANCSSRSSFPAANLTFLINEKEVGNNDFTSHTLFIKSETDGLETARLALVTTAVPSLFPEGRLQLSCLAWQFNLYRQSTALILQEDTPQLAHVLGASPPYEPSGSTSGVLELTISSIFYYSWFFYVTFTFVRLTAGMWAGNQR